MKITHLLIAICSLFLLNSCNKEEKLSKKLWKNGCKEEHSGSINVGGVTITNPNCFTPNGDTNNETFQILFQFGSSDSVLLSNYEIQLTHKKYGTVYSSSVSSKYIHGNEKVVPWNGINQGQTEPIEEIYDVTFSGKIDGTQFAGEGKVTLITQATNFQCDWQCFVSDGTPWDQDGIIAGCNDERNIRIPED